MQDTETNKLQTIPRDYQLNDRLGFQLSRLSKIMQRRLESELALHDLTRLKWCVLTGVDVEGQNSPSDLANHIGITRPAVSRLLKAMIKDGLIERALTEADGRSRKLNISPLGRQKMQACWPLVQKSQAHFLSKLSQDQRGLLAQALRDLMAGETAALDDL